MVAKTVKTAVQCTKYGSHSVLLLRTRSRPRAMTAGPR